MAIKKQVDPFKELQKRLYTTFGWFIVSIISSLLTFKYPYIATLGMMGVCLSFLIFNVFTTLYNLIVFSTKRIIEEKCHSSTLSLPS